MKASSRCGLGQTSFNPVLTSLQSFRYQYETLVKEAPGGRRRGFDLDDATAEATRLRAAEGVRS